MCLDPGVKNKGHQEINPGGRILWIMGVLNISINKTPVFVSAVLQCKKTPDPKIEGFRVLYMVTYKKVDRSLETQTMGSC